MKRSVLGPISVGRDFSDFPVAPGFYLSNPLLLPLEFLGSPLPLLQGHLQELGIDEGSLIFFGSIHVHLEIGLMPASLGLPDIIVDTVYCEHESIINGCHPCIGHSSKIVIPPSLPFFQCFCRGLG